MNELGKSLTDTLNTSDLQNVTNELLETNIDSLLKNGVLKDIPIINSIVGIYKLGVSIKDIIFMKKLIRFLSEINDTSIQERQKVIAKMEKDDKYGRKVGETILTLLDRLDDLNKANIVGILFKALMKGRFDTFVFQRLCHSIDKVFIDDIQELRAYIRGQYIDNDIKSSLYISGLLNRTMFGNITVDGNNEYEVNDLGIILIRELDAEKVVV